MAQNAAFPARVIVFFVLFFVVAIGSFLMFIVALVDMVKRPDWQ
jgi:hypothetical protein